jgi:hypothetical protein
VWFAPRLSSAAWGLFLSDMREKRVRGVRSWITPSLHEQLELFVAERGNVVSMSDYLFEVIERHVEVEKAMRKSSFKIGRRADRLAG